MKTKEQILAWLDKQPWKDEFYKAIFLYGNPKRVYNVNFLISAFHWGKTIQGETIWSKRNKEYQKWYNSTGKPMSWEEYCERTPIKEGDCFIKSFGCVVPMNARGERRNDDSNVNIISKEYYKAFVAYMKLFQLRNAWVKDENLDDSPVTYRILYQDNIFDVFKGHTSTGLSFLDKEEAKEFMMTFKDLLETAKPLL